MAHILLVEPNTVLAQIYQAALQHNGHQVQSTSSAQTAISLADQQRPDLVILELQLAAHNGIEFLYEFRSYPDWQTIPVLVHSVVPQSIFGSHTSLWQELTIADYLYKPSTTLQQLLKAVDDVLVVSHEAT